MRWPVTPALEGGLQVKLAAATVTLKAVRVGDCEGNLSWETSLSACGHGLGRE